MSPYMDGRSSWHERGCLSRNGEAATGVVVSALDRLFTKSVNGETVAAEG